MNWGLLRCTAVVGVRVPSTARRNTCCPARSQRLAPASSGRVAVRVGDRADDTAFAGVPTPSSSGHA